MMAFVSGSTSVGVYSPGVSPGRLTAPEPPIPLVLLLRPIRRETDGTNDGVAATNGPFVQQSPMLITVITNTDSQA